MIVQSGILKEYILSSQVFGRLFGNSSEWNEKQGRLKINSRAYFITTFLGILCGISQLTRLNRPPRSGTDSNTTVAMDTTGVRVLFLAADNLILFYSMVNLRHGGNVEAAINGLIMFEKRYIGNNQRSGSLSLNSHAMKLAKFTCYLWRVAVIQWVPPFFGFSAVLMPTMPFNFLSYPPGSWAMSQLETVASHSWVVWGTLRSGLFLSNTLYWTAMLRSGVLVMIQIMMGSLGLVMSISAFNQQIQGTPFHTLKLVEVTKRVRRLTLIYRQIQILTKLFNFINASPLVILFTIMAASQLVPAVELIKATTNPWWLSVMYAVVMINGTAITPVFGLCANVHEHSKRCLAGLNRNTRLSKDKVCRRVIKSLPVLKVHFGSTNFIAKITPFMFQQFILQRLVDALLLS